MHTGAVRKLELGLSAVLTSSMAALIFLLVRQALTDDRKSPPLPAPTYEPAWKEIAQSGRVVGNPNARFQVTIFTDLQCPGCRREHQELKRVKGRFKEQVAFVIVHFPLSYHRFAYAAARASECAHLSGRFEPFLDVVYAKQDSIGIKTWSSYGHEAGVTSLQEFDACVSDSSKVPLVEAGLSVGKAREVVGTPTVLVNGWRFRGTPPSETVIELLKALAKGRTPDTTGVKRRTTAGTGAQ